MKKLFLGLIVLSTALVSCNKDEDTEVKSESQPEAALLTQTWTLSKMYYAMGDREITGDDMEWQESYALFSDGTFTKERFVDGSVYIVNGTYTLVDETDKRYLELVHDTDNQLIGNCTGDRTEILLMKEDDFAYHNSWVACDGPGLEYQMVLTLH